MSKPLEVETSSFLPARPSSSARSGRHFVEDESALRGLGQAANQDSCICGAQIKAARILLGWSQAQLSWRARVSEGTILRIENGSPEPRKSTRAKIAFALRRAGIDFVDLVGVTLRPDKRNENMVF